MEVSYAHTKEVMELIVKPLTAKGKEHNCTKNTKVTIIADYFIICTASSTTHIKSLSDEAGKILSEAGEPPLRTEATGAAAGC
jgi:ribosome-associated protein